MIVDRLEHAKLYKCLGARLAAGLDYLTGEEHATLPAGRYAIDGERLIAIVDEYTTKPLDEHSIWEAHRRYWDIQYMVTGTERHGVAAIDRVTERVAYNAERDVTFFGAEGSMSPHAGFITLTPGMFSIYTPRDVHAPGLAFGFPAAVRKIVMKVRVD